MEAEVFVYFVLPRFRVRRARRAISSNESRCPKIKLAPLAPESLWPLTDGAPPASCQKQKKSEISTTYNAIIYNNTLHIQCGMIMKFEWDEFKNIENQRKHGINFETACRVFLSEFRLEYDEDNSSFTEDRFRAMGLIEKYGFVIVVFTEVHDDVYRIISARKPGLNEVKKI